MSYTRTRGISLVRTIRIPEPNRKEDTIVYRQFTVRCNASIPFSHKGFQNQYLADIDRPIHTPANPKAQPKSATKKASEQKKLDKWKKKALI